MRAVVYTALFGDYIPLSPLFPHLGCDCVAFTDSQKDLSVEGWEVRPTWSPYSNPRMQAKYFKMHPHILFPEHEVSIWVDASVLIDSPRFAEEAVSYLGEKPLLFFRHSSRTDIDTELAAHLALPKYRDIAPRLQAQVQHYHRVGFHEEFLMECTCLVRRHNDPEAVKFDRAWWEENVIWSYADQLSCPFVLWEQHTPFAVFPFTLAGQKWFRIIGQRSDQ